MEPRLALEDHLFDNVSVTLDLAGGSGVQGGARRQSADDVQQPLARLLLVSGDLLRGGPLFVGGFPLLGSLVCLGQQIPFHHISVGPTSGCTGLHFFSLRVDASVIDCCWLALKRFR